MGPSVAEKAVLTGKKNCRLSQEEKFLELIEKKFLFHYIYHY